MQPPTRPSPAAVWLRGGGHWKLLYLPAVGLGLPRAEQSWKRRKQGMCTQQAARLLLSPDVQQMQKRACPQVCQNVLGGELGCTHVCGLLEHLPVREHR